MPGVVQNQLKIPDVHIAGVNGVRMARIKFHPDDTHQTGIWPGIFTLADTYGQDAIVANSASAGYQVKVIYDANMKKLPLQYVTATELDAAAYYADAIPVGGVTWIASEDADTTPITEANSGSGAVTYATFIITAPAGVQIATVDGPFATPTGSILIDSSTVAASATNPAQMTIQLLGPSGAADNPPYSATTLANPRQFLFKFITAEQSQ